MWQSAVLVQTADPKRVSAALLIQILPLQAITGRTVFLDTNNTISLKPFAAF